MVFEISTFRASASITGVLHRRLDSLLSYRLCGLAVSGWVHNRFHQAACALDRRLRAYLSLGRSWASWHGSQDVHCEVLVASPWPLNLLGGCAFDESTSLELGFGLGLWTKDSSLRFPRFARPAASSLEGALFWEFCQFLKTTVAVSACTRDGATCGAMSSALGNRPAGRERGPLLRSLQPPRGQAVPRRLAR